MRKYFTSAVPRRVTADEQNRVTNMWSNRHEWVWLSVWLSIGTQHVAYGRIDVPFVVKIVVKNDCDVWGFGGRKGEGAPQAAE